MEAKAYTEVNYIINQMQEKNKNKIPEEIRKIIASKMDKNYKFCVENDDFQNVKLLEDTEKLLSVIYTDYLATEEEKLIIKNKEKIIAKRSKN